MSKNAGWLPKDGYYETFTEFGLAELTGEGSTKQQMRMWGRRVAKTAFLLNKEWSDEALAAIAIEYPLEDTCLRY